MTDWAKGDLALAVGPSARPGAWFAKGGPKRGSVLAVDDIVAGPDWVALVFNGFPAPHWTRGWDSVCYRKIKPDTAEPCDPEFVAVHLGKQRVHCVGVGR